MKDCQDTNIYKSVNTNILEIEEIRNDTDQF